MNGTRLRLDAQHFTPDPGALEAQAQVLKAMAHPVRLCILQGLLGEGERNVGELQCSLGAPQSTVSQHLGKLRSAGLLCARRQGTEVYYRLATPLVRRVLRALAEPARPA
ncbi:MAG TPA: metalloregulator ArsR/SmtB family transcription factor [Aggregicoccus sp.]|nr:metalloregulator ArsR/SmtB family transcription factor [Aggregicoccus sp.]